MALKRNVIGLLGIFLIISLLSWMYMPHVHIEIQLSSKSVLDKKFSEYRQNGIINSTKELANQTNSNSFVTQLSKAEQTPSGNEFVFMFGNTSVQVSGSIPLECSLLFIGIHSGPDMAPRRNAMRETYLKGKSSDIAHRFILGNPTSDLIAENTQHNDMVFINQTERYTALDSVLPYKAATIMILASRMAVKPSWLLKTDDDSLINLPAVLKKLPEFIENFYYGYCLFGSKPIRDPNSKWHVNEELWPNGKGYPPFCVGTGYFMSRIAYDCAAALIQSPAHQYFPREDVSGGVMMSECNIKALSLPMVYPDGPPSAYRHFLIQHYVKSPKHVHRLWKQVLLHQ